MGKRKRLMAERLKETKKQTAIAKLNDVPTSPRKMRLVCDTIRGVEVNHALDLLHYSKRDASVRLEKLLKSAIANWEAKNPEQTKEKPSWWTRVAPSSASARARRAVPVASASVPTTLPSYWT